MSVSLEEVLLNAGYDIRNSIEDAMWLQDQKGEFDELVEKAEELEDMYDDYMDARMTAEEDGDFNYPSFNEWRLLNNKKGDN